MSMVVVGCMGMKSCCIHDSIFLYSVSFSLVYGCGIYVDMAIMGQLSCGLRVAAVTWSQRWCRAGIGFTSL